MFKKFQWFVIGFFVCSIFSTPISAAIKEYICSKADYKVAANGKLYTNPDYPILNYKGATYLPLRPFLEFAGFTVNWDAKLGQANVTTTSKSDIMEPGNGGNAMSKTTQTPDGLKVTFYMETPYVDITTVYNKYSTKNGGAFDMKADLVRNVYIISKNGTIIAEIPLSNLKHPYGPDSNLRPGMFEYDYYVNTVMPLFQ